MTPGPRFIRIALTCALVAASLVSATAQTPTAPTVVQVPDFDEDIVAVRYLAEQFVAVSGKGTVLFSRDGTSWQRRFTAPSPLADVVHANGRYVLILGDLERNSAYTRKLPTWTSTDGVKWTELHGRAVQGVNAIAGRFVTRGVRFEGDRTIEQILVSRDAEQWETRETLPPELASATGRIGSDYLVGGRMYRGRSGKVTSTTDLKTWRDEFEIPAPPAGSDNYELLPIFCAGGETLIAGTMVSIGAGPVHIYRRHRDGDWQRLEPSTHLRFLHALQFEENFFVATSSRDKVYLSRDGHRWKPVADLPGCSAHFAAGRGVFVFGGRLGRFAVLKPAREWSDFSLVAPPAFATGPKWETVHKGRSADELFEMAQTVFRLAKDQETALSTLKEAVAVAETGSSATKYRLAEMLINGSFGIPKDEARAVRLLIAASNAGFAAAQLDYAQLLAAGRFGVAQDIPRANNLAQSVVRDAEKAAPDVQYKAGMLLAQGGMFGVARDLPRAVKLMTAAAEAGLLPAQLDAGRALLSGALGVPAEPMRGVALLKKAAEQKHPAAAALLGEVFERGAGVPADLKQAAIWYQQAIALGMKQAEPALQRVQAAQRTAGGAP